MCGFPGEPVRRLAQEDDAGPGAAEAADQCLDLRGSGGVQRCQRLVQDEHVRFRDDGTAYGEPAQLPAGERGRVPVQQVRESGAGSRALHSAEHVLPGRRAVFQAEGQLLRDCGAHRGEHRRGVLRNEGHAAGPLGGVDPGVLGHAAEFQHRAAELQAAAELSGVTGPEPAGQKFAQRGFSAPGPAQDGGQGTRRDRECGIPQHRGVIAVERERLDPDLKRRAGGGRHDAAPAGQEATIRPATAAAANTSAAARKSRWAGGSATSR